MAESTTNGSGVRPAGDGRTIPPQATGLLLLGTLDFVGTTQGREDQLVFDLMARDEDGRKSVQSAGVFLRFPNGDLTPMGARAEKEQRFHALIGREVVLSVSARASGGKSPKVYLSVEDIWPVFVPVTASSKS